MQKFQIDKHASNNRSDECLLARHENWAAKRIDFEVRTERMMRPHPGVFNVFLALKFRFIGSRRKFLRVARSSLIHPAHLDVFRRRSSQSLKKRHLTYGRYFFTIQSPAKLFCGAYIYGRPLHRVRMRATHRVP